MRMQRIHFVSFVASLSRSLVLFVRLCLFSISLCVVCVCIPRISYLSSPRKGDGWMWDETTKIDNLTLV